MRVSSARGGGAHVQLEPLESRLLQDLASQLLELVTDPPSPGGDPLEQLLGIRDRAAPEDPVLQRLLPDSHHDDPELSAELRRLGEGDLRRSKAEAAQRLFDDADKTGTDVVLDDGSVWLWLRGLTDIRLALGTRLGISDEVADGVTADDPRRDALMVYGWLGELQERIILALEG